MMDIWQFVACIALVVAVVVMFFLDSILDWILGKWRNKNGIES